MQSVHERVSGSDHPYYAFNSGCDMALLSKLLGIQVFFDRELQRDFERKQKTVDSLGILQFDDPFGGDGFQAAKAWTRHMATSNVDEVRAIMAHNLACVLKEYQILVLRGSREIEKTSHAPFLRGEGDLI